MKSMVVAYDLQRGIGADNELLWQPGARGDMPADMAHYRALTKGKTIIMGRKTFESIGRALPDRQNIVVTHRPLSVPDVTAVPTLPEAYAAAEHDIAIIGGGTIYEQALPDADVIYATEVQASLPQATVFFPTLDESWQEVDREHHEADEQNKYAYDFVMYKRK